MSDSFLTLPASQVLHAELEIKRSRFIALAKRVDDQEQARTCIDGQKAQYPDARHHCSAYTFLPRLSNPITHSSDDGEPSGTAGRPMLDALLGSGLQNICVVVTRYFGGVKLGTGGLVRAYSSAVEAVLENCPRLRVEEIPVVNFTIGLTQAPAIESWLRDRDTTPLHIDWQNGVTFTVALTTFSKQSLESALATQLCEAVILHDSGTQVLETPLS